MSTGGHPLDALQAALEQERQALLQQDVEHLLESTRAKLAALNEIESSGFRDTTHDRVRALSEFNRANGALLMRRRREVNWALRHLGMTEARGTYGADGATRAKMPARHFGTV